jgi:hypothetical protein
VKPLTPGRSPGRMGRGRSRERAPGRAHPRCRGGASTAKRCFRRLLLRGRLAFGTLPRSPYLPRFARANQTTRTAALSQVQPAGGDEQPPADRCGRDCGAVSGSSAGLRRRRCRDPRSFGRRTGLRSRGVGCAASATRNVLVRVRRLWRFRREVEGWKLGGTSVHLGRGRRETARIRSAERCVGMTATAPVPLMRSPTVPTRRPGSGS